MPLGILNPGKMKSSKTRLKLKKMNYSSTNSASSSGVHRFLELFDCPGKCKLCGKALSKYKEYPESFIRKRKLGHGWIIWAIKQVECPFEPGWRVNKEDVKTETGRSHGINLYRNLNLSRRELNCGKSAWWRNLSAKPDSWWGSEICLNQQGWLHKYPEGRKENAELQKKIAANSNLPDVKLSGSVSSKGQTDHIA